MLEGVWRPRKRWGQSFLHDGNIARKIVALADIRCDDTVVEIGPGTGALTTFLVPHAQKLILIEVDPCLVVGLERNFGSVERVEIVHGDVLAFDFATAAKKYGVEKFKVVANVPYSIASPILFHLLAARQLVSTATLMVQKEVADRITSRPGTKEYGIPTVLLSVYGSIERAFDVPPTCFHPVPRVVSSVIKIAFHPDPIMPMADEELFRRLVRQAFHHRRKTLINNLLSWRDVLVPYDNLLKLWRDLKWDLRVRAESLAPHQFVQLSNELAKFMK